MSKEVRIRRGIVERMEKEAQRTPERECCGLLAGRAGVIGEIFPASNALGSATEFEIAPTELFRIFRAIREAGLEHMGIYHSHPRGANAPSARDIERAYYPEAAYFVISPDAKAPNQIRAFWIRNGKVVEIAIRII